MDVCCEFGYFSVDNDCVVYKLIGCCDDFCIFDFWIVFIMWCVECWCERFDFLVECWRKFICWLVLLCGYWVLWFLNCLIIVFFNNLIVL